jgi:lysozyme
MRSPGVVVLVFSILGLAGCSSTGGVDDLVPRPSNEVTSSISKPDAPVPDEEVGDEAAVAADELAPDVTEEAPAAVETAAVAPDDKPELPAETTALVARAKPVAADAVLKTSKVYRYGFRDAKPINFGKASPRKLAVHGVDVSRWQGKIDWAKLRSRGANFAYIKATDGGDHLDPMFRKNWRAAGEAGLRRGAYHFFYWCRTAGEQADWFIRNVPRVAGALPPVIDVEWNGESSCKRRPSRAKVLEKMQVFMDKLEAHYGQRPIIYTAPDFYRDNLRGAFPNHPFWLRSVARHPSKTYPGRKWVFWQYSGSGLSHGVRGRIDLNVFNGSEADWHQWVSGADG